MSGMCKRLLLIICACGVSMAPCLAGTRRKCDPAGCYGGYGLTAKGACEQVCVCVFAPRVSCVCLLHLMAPLSSLSPMPQGPRKSELNPSDGQGHS